jgi:hypothetical protein
MVSFCFSLRVLSSNFRLSQSLFLVSAALASAPLVAEAQPSGLTRVSYASNTSRWDSSHERGSLQGRALLQSPILDAGDLEELATRFNIPVTPVYAFGAEGEVGGAEVLGIRDSAVWDVRVTGRLLSLRKVGSSVPVGDSRLRPLEASVAGSKILVAYEGPAGELTAVLISGQGLFSARRLEDKTIAISRVSPNID